MPHEIRVPRLGWSMEEGTFVGWLKKPGDEVCVGDALFELEGEKALQEIESVDAGVLQIPPGAPEPGSVVAVGALLGYLVPVSSGIHKNSDDVAGASVGDAASVGSAGGQGDRGVEGPEDKGSDSDFKSQIASQSTMACRPSDAGSVGHGDHGRDRGRKTSSPRARRVAEELGVDWTTLSGSGRGGRVRESDVRTASGSGIRQNSSVGSGIRQNSPVGSGIRQNSLDGEDAPLVCTTAASNESAGPESSLPISPRRRAIAERLRASQVRTVPVTLTTTADATALIALRAREKEAGSEPTPTFADIVAWLAARVLPRHTRLCARWANDRQSLVPVPFDQIHLGIAVDTPDGLLVPVARDVARKPLEKVARETRALVDRARAGRLTSSEMSGGVLTVTNLGAYGIDAFTPVINEPELSILGLGAIRRQPVATSDGRIVAQDRITLSLTFDHAAIDGAPAAAFLRDVVVVIESGG